MKLKISFNSLIYVFLILIFIERSISISNTATKNNNNNSNNKNFAEKIFNQTEYNNNDSENYENDDDFVVVNLSEFVARVKGGHKQAQRIAKKFNLKLVKQVVKRFIMTSIHFKILLSFYFMLLISRQNIYNNKQKDFICLKS